MHRLNFWRREVAGDEPNTAQRSSLNVPIRDAERRRLARLETRRMNLEFDLSRAESAFLPHNRWTERIEQLDEAIAQANEDIAQLVPRPSDIPTVQLEPEPIAVTVVSTAEPAEIVLQAGNVKLDYREEVDWAERGHQLALPVLALFDGDVRPLIPETLDGAQQERLAEHLRNSFSIIANEALERATDREPLPELTLADLTQPCTRCGGWLDPKGRCPACTQLDWQRDAIAEAAHRLAHERSEVVAEMEQARERLPVIRRQLQDVDQDIAELRAKGVEPE
ncbi:MAG TPA: hypothetical protein VHA53_13475 [Nitrolancea sp.]|jgi:hypothetical protein|nr:hypothetical protein [Nitrolancea sp.]